MARILDPSLRNLWQIFGSESRDQNWQTLYQHHLKGNCEKKGGLCRLEKVKGATRLGATELRASEREICRSEGLWKDLWKPLKNVWKPLKPLKTSKDLWKRLKTLPLRDPLRGRFPSHRLLVLLPLFICPLNSLRPPWIHENVCWGGASDTRSVSACPSRLYINEPRSKQSDDDDESLSSSSLHGRKTPSRQHPFQVHDSRTCQKFDTNFASAFF